MIQIFTHKIRITILSLKQLGSNLFRSPNYLLLLISFLCLSFNFRDFYRKLKFTNHEKAGISQFVILYYLLRNHGAERLVLLTKLSKNVCVSPYMVISRIKVPENLGVTVKWKLNLNEGWKMPKLRILCIFAHWPAGWLSLDRSNGARGVYLSQVSVLYKVCSNWYKKYWREISIVFGVCLDAPQHQQPRNRTKEF